MVVERTVSEILAAPVVGDVIDPPEPLVWDGQRWCLLSEVAARVFRVQAQPGAFDNLYGTPGL